VNRVRGLRLVPLLLLVAATNAACAPPSPTPSPSSPAPRPTIAAYCPSYGEWQQAGFTDAKGVHIDAVTRGTGSTAVVLAGTCPIPYANQLAATGYKVLAFDFHDSKVSAELGDDTQDANVAAAVEYLRGHGAQTIVLIGKGTGGTAALVAAPRITPPVAGVITISAPAWWYGDVDALKAASKLTVPVLYIAGEGDPLTADDAKKLYDATPGGARTLLMKKSDHNNGLLDLGDVLAAMKTFLDRYAPPTR
jgi:pimeloyl-ACP methyl ester carboxylesterase